MKFIIIVALCIFAAEALMTKEEAREAYREVAVACAAETGATNADIETMMNHLPAQNKETKCLRACAMKKFNVLSADCKLNKEVLLQIAEIQAQGNADMLKRAEEVANICHDIAVPDDYCDAAELYKMCLVHESEKRGMKIA